MDKQLKQSIKMACQFYAVILVTSCCYVYLLDKFGLPFIRWVMGHFN